MSTNPTSAVKRRKSPARVAAGKLNGRKGGRPKTTGKGEMLPWRMPRGTRAAVEELAGRSGMAPGLWLALTIARIADANSSPSE